MSIGYHLVQSLGNGVYKQRLYKIHAVMIALRVDDFGCIRNLSDWQLGGNRHCGKPRGIQPSHRPRTLSTPQSTLGCTGWVRAQL